MTRQEIDTLAIYNGERSRGIVHTPEWDAKMADLQRRFGEEPLPDPFRKNWLRRWL